MAIAANSDRLSARRGGTTLPFWRNRKNTVRIGRNWTNINLAFNDLGISSAELNNIGVPGGTVHILSATLDPIVHLNPKGHVDFYITGGGGWFRRYQQFTQPGVAVVTGFDPFFGFYPAAIPTTQVLASYSVNRPGIDIGAGLAVGALGRGKIFAEAKYDHIYMKGTHTDYIPVTFGFRW